MNSSIKTFIQITLWSAMFVALAGADGCGGKDKTTEITILHTNDIHSHFKAEKAGTERNPFGLGGLARIKTLADKIRKEKPNSVLLDAGDWSENHAYYSVDGGINMLRALNMMGYNAAVVGNHDFLNGPSVLTSSIEAAALSYPVLGANKNIANVPEKERMAKAVQDYTILNVGGVRIGIIGLMTDELTYYEYFKPAIITNPIETASRLARKLHDEKLADVILLLSHNSIKSHVNWAKSVPWVNAIISGHSHAKTPKPIEVMNAGRPAWVVEAKEWGQFLGELTLIVNKETGQVSLKNYTLHPISSDIAEDSAMVAFVEEQDRALKARYGKNVDDVVAHCDGEMNHNDGKEVPVTNMLTDAYRQATGAQIAMESVMLTNEGLSPGPVTWMELYTVQPHIFGPLADKPFPEFGRAWHLNKLTLKGVSLRGLLNVVMLADSFGIPLGWINLSGAQVHYSKKSNGASPVQTINVLNSANGQYEPLDEQAYYTVALHDGLHLALRLLIQKLGLNIDISRLEDTGIEAWQALFSWVDSKGGQIKISEYETGQRYRAAEADLGLYEHGVQVKPRMDGKGYVVAVAVQNDGLTASAPGAFKLHVTRSAPNDVVNDFTDGNEKTPIAEDAFIPILGPNDRTIIEFPWNDVPASGMYSIKAAIVGVAGEDGNKNNDDTLIHTTVSAAVHR